jgi:cytochrome c-type biogenesis protein CcmH/NrfG
VQPGIRAWPKAQTNLRKRQNRKQLRQGRRLFESITYPQSGNVYDSLAEAYMDNGDKQLAIENYQKSIQLNPSNKNAVEMLKKLNAP